MEVVEKALKLLSMSNDSSYRIAGITGITEATIGNYRNGKTKPTKANAMVLLQYFSNHTGLLKNEDVEKLEVETIALGKKASENISQMDTFKYLLERIEMLTKKITRLEIENEELNKRLANQ